MKYLYNTLLVSLISISLISCGGGTTASESAAATETAVAMIADSISLSIEGNDLMQYNTDKLSAVEGQVVTLTLKHTGGMSVEAMGHNWVLLATGTDAAMFGGAAVSAKSTGYIPQDMTDKVIANTETIGGGEETSITFTAPKAGYYTFICSFPGHYGVMQGSFVSSPR
ncbi:MAG: azurin [Cyclobacteriaceae bacterium]|jgi:azurin